MFPSSADSTDVKPVERFKPTNGGVIGVAGLLFVGVAVGYVLFSVHTVTGLRVGLGAAFFGLVVWVTQLRPRATAYPYALRMKNSLRDTRIPLTLIDEVAVGRTLNVWVGDKRFVCIGIGKARKTIFKSSKRGAATLLGFERLHEYAEEADRPHPEQNATLYETFVVRRIEELVDAAKRELRGAPVEGKVRHELAW